jgi:integrase
MARWTIQERPHKDGTKSYRLQVELPFDPLTGKRQRRTGTFRTKKEAEKEAIVWVAEADSGLAVTPSKLTLADVAARWLDVLRGTNPKPRTVSEYERVIRSHILAHIGTIPVQKVTPVVIDGLYAALRAAGASDDKVHRVHQRLAQIFDYATKRRIIAMNPMLAIDAPTVRSAPPTILTIPQIQRFLTFAEKDGYDPLWLLIVQTGMRRGEALGLRWQDVDVEKRRLQVRQALEMLDGKPHLTTPKTKAALRTISLFPESVAALKAHRARQNEERLRAGAAWQDNDLVFATPTGGPLNANNVYWNLMDIQRAANGQAKEGRNGKRWKHKSVVPQDDADLLPRFNIHDLRHTHAVHLLHEGWPIPTVSRRLGHANPAITMAIYAHALTDVHGDEMQTPAAFAFTGTR